MEIPPSKDKSENAEKFRDCYSASVNLSSGKSPILVSRLVEYLKKRNYILVRGIKIKFKVSNKSDENKNAPDKISLRGKNI
jgi:hypothetical protein